jgi:hypothetical protein
MERTPEQQYAHEWLSQFRYTKEYLKTLEAAYKRDTALYEWCCPGRAYSKPMRELLAAYNREINRIRREYDVFLDVVRSVPNEEQRTILTLHHDKGMTFDRIAETIYSCPRTTLRKYQKALTAVYFIICPVCNPVCNFGENRVQSA